MRKRTWQEERKVRRHAEQTQEDLENWGTHQAAARKFAEEEAELLWERNLLKAFAERMADENFPMTGAGHRAAALEILARIKEEV